MPSHPNPAGERPTIEQLAKVYVHIEGEEKVAAGPTANATPVETPPEFRQPTTDQLAGIYVCIGAEEKTPGATA